MNDTIARLTGQLASYLKSAATENTNVKVTTGRPGMSVLDLFRPRINVYLLDANEGPSRRNDFVPSVEGQDGPVGLELRYLVTFYGTGKIPLVLMQQSLKALADRSTFSPVGGSSPASNVHLSLVQAGTDELQKIWTMMRVRHAPSLLCKVTGLTI